MLHKSDYRETGIPVIMPQDIGDRTLSLDGIARIGKQDAERLARYVTVDMLEVETGHGLGHEKQMKLVRFAGQAA